MHRPALSPVWLVLIGILSVQFGAAIAKGLFDEIDPTAMVFLRLATSAVFFAAVTWRPTRRAMRGRTRADWSTVIAFGVALVSMNWAIYQSFSRIPLGIAVTIEFVGPLALAVLASRRPRDLVWAALAAAGVALLGLERTSVTLAGVLLALLAGAAWASYIVLSARPGRAWPGLTGLTIASIVGTVLVAPAAIWSGREALLDPRLLALGAAVGLLSSVVPYSLELIALRTLPAQTLSILMSLEPAAAALAGALLLHEMLEPIQLVAMACVIAASVGAARSHPAVIAEPVAN